MLQRVEIKNIALIDNVSIEVGEGFNVLTGETGAGKSIIIDSINAIIGERASKDVIRTGAERALVEAAFDVGNNELADVLGECGIEIGEDGVLILSREITLGGRSTCRVNGKLVTLSLLKTIGERLVDMHGQYDNQSLLKTEKHVDLLDMFGGEEIQILKSEYMELLGEYRRAKDELKLLSGNSIEREKRIDYIKYQIDEIQKANLKIGEEQELSEKRALLLNSEKIITALSAVYELLFSGNVRGSAYDLINEMTSQMGTISKLGGKFPGFLEKLEGISYQMEDLAAELRSERDNTEFDPGRLEIIEERMDLLFSLKKKYGDSVEEIINYCRDAKNQLEELEGSRVTADNLEAAIRKIDNELLEKAEKIHQKRVQASKLLEERIGKELHDLEMKKAYFKVDIQFKGESAAGNGPAFRRDGLDNVEFLISTNPGEPLKPLSRIASGGEMSRIMLAIKTILADVDQIPVLIFDEIDNGIGGKTSQKVGEKLAFLSRTHQVICVTHLAQIACMADKHFLIQKVLGDNSTETRVTRLSGIQVRDEVARMLGGAAITDIAVQHAEEMLNSAYDFKKISIAGYN